MTGERRDVEAIVDQFVDEVMMRLSALGSGMVVVVIGATSVNPGIDQLFEVTG